MTATQIRTSIELQMLHLNRSQRLNHYFPAHASLFVGLCLPGLTLMDWVIDRRIDSVLSFSTVVLFSLPWLLAAVLLYRHLDRVLALSKVTTPLGVPEIRKLLVVLARREGWSTQKNSKTSVVMKTDPGFSWNWGEKITILFYNGEVWVISICDPDFESAFYSSGRNKRNRNLVHQSLTGNRRASD